MRFLLSLFLCFVIGVQMSMGQDIEELDKNYSEFWSDITFGKALNDKWTVGGDGGVRAAFNSGNFKLFYVRPNINYKVLPFFNLTFGLGSFNTFSSDYSNVFEFRIYQDANFRGPKLGPFNFMHRIRLEQRFFTFSDNDIDNEFSFRGRYLIGTRTDKFSLGGEKNWTVFVSLEPFFPLGKGVTEILANNFRWDTALSYQVSENLRLELHYVLQTSEIFSNSDTRVLENIFRFRIFQKL
ncbi:MAG: DUF2490 domain-containing protein [Eudoraea sp.]|nr:DUF2490 domain-containing protein [Eudoraea sp.]NNL02559.1 DUF2490 domain-containing protein [Eudoraea sp.]